MQRPCFELGPYVYVSSLQPSSPLARQPRPRPTACVQVLLASPAFRLALAGHDHMGGCACINGRHFVTLEALLEAPPGSNAFAVLHVFGDRIRIAGSGSVTSRELAV